MPRDHPIRRRATRLGSCLNLSWRVERSGPPGEERLIVPAGLRDPRWNSFRSRGRASGSVARNSVEITILHHSDDAGTVVPDRAVLERIASARKRP